MPIEISRARSLVLLLSVSILHIPTFPVLTFSGLQLPRMAVIWWPLGVRKEYGSGPEMTHSVLVFSAFVMILPDSKCSFSPATGATSPRGDSMRHAGRFRDLPRTRRQGTS